MILVKFMMSLPEDLETLFMNELMLLQIQLRRKF